MFKYAVTNKILGITMKRQTMFLSFFTLGLLLINTSCGIANTPPQSTPFQAVSSTRSAGFPAAITVSTADPFYTLIATPLAVFYNNVGEQTVMPLYVKDLTNPSTAVQRTEAEIGLYADYTIAGLSAKQSSLLAAALFWQSSNTALVLQSDATGYNLGVVATPIASYLNIPVIVTDVFDANVIDVLESLGVTQVYVCGTLPVPDEYAVIRFTDPDQITTMTIQIIEEHFDTQVQYITMTNPLDTQPPQVLDSTYFETTVTTQSAVALPSQVIGLLLKGSGSTTNFTIPDNYKYALVSIDLINLNSENVQLLGDKLALELLSPTNEIYLFSGTSSGHPILDNKGNIITDRLRFDTVLYDRPGIYTLLIYGYWFGSTRGSYALNVTVKKLDSPLLPLMDDISSVAPYLTAYHQGVVFSNTSFAFAADDDVLHNGSTCPGMTQAGGNPNLTVPANLHTMQIHDQLNELLSEISGIPTKDLQQLREYYRLHPLSIAIVADPTMVPMYFYYNPDGLPDTPNGGVLGYSVPSDFIYADIDVDHVDPENDTYSSWPFMENIVGRVTGWDAQDCSALIARTIFYNTIIGRLGEWKNNALVQTGCGLEFQNLPVITRLGQLLYSGRGEPTKFPTGESELINLRLTQDMKTGGFNAQHTFYLQSQRIGFTKEGLDKIRKAGLLNFLIFPGPEALVHFLSSQKKVTGGQLQLNSSFIFGFAHGFYNLFEFGDILMDSRGFPGVTTLARLDPIVRSDLSGLGSYEVRTVQNMNYGPSVVFIESCITARTDGIDAENVLSQAFVHAGVNAYIGATRVTADPGYLEPRPLPNGWGIGILGLTKAIVDLKVKKKYPDPHFGAVIAENVILELIQHNVTIGMALRDAKNMYLPIDANSTFLWSPPLSLHTGFGALDAAFQEASQLKAGSGRTPVLDKKYVALHEFALYGDPAFNPYQPVNNG
jgi:hypothetical protein